MVMKSLYNIVESLDELYHYTNVDNAIDMVTDDKFLASENDGSGRKDYRWYMSTTRQRNALTGYPTGMINNHIVRFVLDGRTLGAKFKIEPVDWGHAKHMAIKNNWPNQDQFDKNYDSIRLQTNVENEDRVYLKSEVLKDLHKYIKEIHLNDRTTTRSEQHLFKTYCDAYGIVLRIMSDKEFTLGR